MTLIPPGRLSSAELAPFALEFSSVLGEILIVFAESLPPLLSPFTVKRMRPEPSSSAEPAGLTTSLGGFEAVLPGLPAAKDGFCIGEKFAGPGAFPCRG